ncbi:MAG: hypothetical protein EOO28_07570 [Comamonadaceae bacterium]|nr:MAG: hypothetical protein EOO28_07570 [Comamonadaceae bacterium]
MVRDSIPGELLLAAFLIAALMPEMLVADAAAGTGGNTACGGTLASDVLSRNAAGASGGGSGRATVPVATFCFHQMVTAQ